MTGSRSTRWPLVAVLAFAAMWNVAPARAQGCEPESAYQQAVGSAGGDVPVPIVIHIMERPGKACEVRQRWTSEQVKIVFGPGTIDPRGVNSVWSGTSIRFSVRGVELHDDQTPPGDMVDAQRNIKVPLTGPRGDDTYEAAFTALVDKFHRDGSVNVYLWRRISGGPLGDDGPLGFGRSKRTGNGKATVFLDIRCFQGSLRACATVVAHEFGHTLGLYHAGGSCDKVDPEFRDLCKSLAAPCPPVKLAARLMKTQGTGRALCPLEGKQAECVAKNQCR